MYDINTINIGEALRSFRKINRLTLSEVGKKLNRTKATISKYEKNEIIPDTITLLKLCNALNISLSDLFPVNEHFNKFPFSNELYLYYLKDEEILSSIINIFIDNYKYKVTLCKYSQDNNLEYCLDGLLEYDAPIISISLKNNTISNVPLKSMQIITNTASVNTLNCFNCFIIDVFSNFAPTTRKGIISQTPISNISDYTDLLTIKKSKSKQIFSNNEWKL